MAVSAKRFVVCLAPVGALFLAYQTISGRLACAWGVSHLARFDKHGLGDSRNILEQPRSFRGLSLELSQTISWCCFGTQNIFVFEYICCTASGAVAQTISGLSWGSRPFLGRLGLSLQNILGLFISGLFTTHSGRPILADFGTISGHFLGLFSALQNYFWVVLVLFWALPDHF